MLKNSYKKLPNEKGYFGQFGGRYVSETLMPLIIEVEKEYERVKNEKSSLTNLIIILRLMLEDLAHYFLLKELQKI